MKIFTLNYLKQTVRVNLFGSNFSFMCFSQKNEQDETMKNVKLNISKEEQNLPTTSKLDNDLLFAEQEQFVREEELSRHQNLINFRKHIELENQKHKVKSYHKAKIALGLFVMFLGLFSLWVPLYRTICESQGFSMKTTHSDYKFDGKECIFYLFSKIIPQVYSEVCKSG
jgi:hypothetical protein